MISSNAPADWPPVPDGEIVEGDPESLPRVARALKEGFGEYCDVTTNRLLLFKEGVFEVPIVVRRGDRRTPVFVYATRSSESAGRQYARHREACQLLEFDDAAVYFAACDVPESERPESLLGTRYSSRLFRSASEGPSRDYAVWWPSQDDRVFAQSTAVVCLSSIAEALDGFATYYWAETLRTLGIVKSNVARVELPTTTECAEIAGPNGMFLAISASLSNGVLVHFDAGSTRAPDRDAVLRQLSASIRGFSRVIPDAFRRKRFKEDEPRSRQGRKWWENFVVETERERTSSSDQSSAIRIPGMASASFLRPR